MNTEQLKNIAEKLNVLLADYQVLTMSTRNFHWNIQGENFFEIHSKYGELYENFSNKTDEIAEHILALGFIPLHTFADYLRVAQIHEAPTIHKSRLGIEYIHVYLRKIVALEREILIIADEANDMGTDTLLTDYIVEQEKQIWMLGAFLK